MMGGSSEMPDERFEAHAAPFIRREIGC